MSALEVQVGGGHYKDFPIQPVEFCQKNKLDYCESNIVKYACRWREKNGLQDLLKIKHYVDLIIEIEELEEVESSGSLAQRDKYTQDLLMAEEMMRKKVIKFFYKNKGLLGDIS